MDTTALRKNAVNLAKKPLTRRLAIGLVLLVLLFGLFGYFALPGIIQSQAERLITEKLKRPTTIERVDVSPYRLAVTIQKLKMMEPDGRTTFASFDELEANLSLQSLFRFAPVVEELRLVKPYVHLVRTAKNHYSIDDIIEELTKQPPSKEPPRFSLYNIQIEEGQIEFDDQPEYSKHTVTELTLGIPFISSLPSKIDVFVEPLLSAKINGAPLQIKAKAHPFGEAKEAAIDLDLDGISLPHYLEYLPFQPQFKLPQGSLDLHLNVSFRQPKDEAMTLSIKGSTSLKNLRITELDGRPLIRLPDLTVTLDELNPFADHLNIAKVALTDPEVNLVKARDGTLNLMHMVPSAGQESAATSDNGRAVQLALDELSIKGGAVKYDDQQTAQPLTANLDKFALVVKKLTADLKKHELSIAEISSDSAVIGLLHGKRATTSAKTGASRVDKKTADTSGYAINIGKIALTNWSARLEDRNLKKPVVTQIAPLALTLEGLSNTTGSKAKIALQAAVNRNGSLAASGTVGIAPLYADVTLNLKEVDILAAQPYFTDQVNLLLTRANLSSKGVLHLEQDKAGAIKGGFKGDVMLGQVATVDKVSANDFVSWKSLAFGGVNLQLEPLSLSIDQVALNDFFARVFINRQGRINLQDVIRGAEGPSKSLTEAADKTDGEAEKPVAATSAKTPAKKMPPIKIKKLTMQGGKVRFSDYYIRPNYTANLVGLGGTVTGLSSAENSAANVALRGKVNSAPLTINGKVNPLKGDLFLDLNAAVKGMELAPLSAYSGKYVGYGIEKGKLSFDVSYKVENRALKAENHLVLDQLTFGDKIDSKQALNLPVQLAVALLRDRNGVIDLNLPIGGSLDDPQFSIGGIIVKMFVNLIGKAVTAPFTLLGSLFGGGEDLSWVNFDPGSVTITATAENKLAALSKALINRPALKLEITGRADPVSDRDGLARVAIARKVRALKVKDLVAKGQPAPAEGVSVSKDEYAALLTRVYRDEKFSKPRNLVGLAKSLPVADMEQLMIKNANITEADLIALGNRRSQAAKDKLIANGAPAERIFLLASKSSSSGDKQGPNRIDFSLK